MAEYITKIRTESGDLLVDYNSLANLPQPDTTLAKSGSFADAKSVGDKIKSINERIAEIAAGDALSDITINGKKLSDNPVLIASDVGAAATEHSHSATDITSGALSVARGGTGSSNGSTGLQNLLAAGAMVLSNNQYGKSLPSSGVTGQIYFVKVQ